MKILHITAHLGGGVGKAHSALCVSGPEDIRRHYVLLETPRDTRYTDMIRAGGAEITIAPDDMTLRQLADEADIVQIEWWNHPRIYECLCRSGLPAMRTVFWSHISGLFAPYIPAGLFTAAGRFAFTSACSFNAPNLADLDPVIHDSLAVVNSGFGFQQATSVERPSRPPLSITYLGTVDFAKMSPDLFTAIDTVNASDLSVSIWGSFDPDGTVTHAATQMANPGRIRFRGPTADPALILADTDIFLYLLQPQHFGTAENALIEAMSLGAVPIVFGNPAEQAIVRHGETGFVEKDSASVARRLAWMLVNSEAVMRIGRQAMDDVNRTRTPTLSAWAFADIYLSLAGTEKRVVDFMQVLGQTPAHWFLSTQTLARGGKPAVSFPVNATESKGSISHFLDCFPGDPSLSALAGIVSGRPSKAQHRIEVNAG